MPPKLQHLRSDVPEKRPDPALLEPGQAAQNRAIESPGMFFSNAAGGLTKVGPCHVGPTAPNATPAGSAGNSKGEQWVDTSGPTPVLKTWDGINQWLVSGGGSSVSTGDIAPTSPVNGDLWFRTDVGQLYVWYDDGTSAQWVEANTGGGGGGDFVEVAGDTMTGPLQVPSIRLGAAGGVTADASVDRWRIYETGGTQRGAYLTATDCAAGIGSKILTSVNSKQVNQFKFTAGVVLNDLTLNYQILQQISFSGVNSYFSTGTAAIGFSGGSLVGVTLHTFLVDAGSGGLITGTYQGVRNNAQLLLNGQYGIVSTISGSGLDPAKTYVIQLLVKKDAAQGPTVVLDPCLALLGQSIILSN